MSSGSVNGSGGGITTQGNRTFLFGSASRINTSALIEAAVNQRLAEADRIDVRVGRNTKRAEALGEMQSLAQGIQNSLAALRRSYTVGTSSSVFDRKAGTLSGPSNINPSSLLDVAIDQNATNATYSIQVNQLAQSQKVRSSNFASATVAQGLSGSFSIGQSGSPSSTINISASMSLNDIAAAINATSSTSNVTASVLQVAPGQNQLILSSKDTNRTIDNAFISGANVLQSLGVTDSGGAYLNQIQGAQAAQIVLDGITITRDSNRFNDVVSGVEFNLKAASPGNNLSVAVGADTSALKDRILDFVESFNAFRDFVIQNQAVANNGEIDEDAVLFGDQQLKNLSEQITQTIRASFGPGGAAFSTLRDLGITLDRSNKFQLDEAKLDTAIASKFQEVSDIFQTRITNPNADFRMLGNGNILSGLAMNFDISHDGSAITGVTVNGDNNAFDISGSSITGKAGTIYEGMRFGYIGTTNTSFTFDFNQGLGDLLDNVIDRFSDAVTGSLQTEIKDLDARNIELNLRADRVRERAEDFRERLIEKYARFEAQLSSSQSTLNQLRAILGTNRNNNN
jgi:flagellar hook-associated protein 2